MKLDVIQHCWVKISNCIFHLNFQVYFTQRLCILGGSLMFRRKLFLQSSLRKQRFPNFNFAIYLLYKYIPSQMIFSKKINTQMFRIKSFQVLPNEIKFFGT